MRQLIWTKFISNNRPSFHLPWKENLVKHRKVWKYYETDCRSRRQCTFCCIIITQPLCCTFYSLILYGNLHGCMIIEQSCMIFRLVRTIYDFIKNALPCPRRPVCNVLLTQGLLFVCVVPYHIEVFSSCTILCSNLFISDVFSGIKHWEENG